MSAPKGGNRLQKKSSGQRHWTLILFMVPGLVYLLINNYIPMAGIMLAFKKVNYTLGIFKSPWCGLSNFKYLFKTKDAAIIFRNTVLYNLAFIVLGTAAAVALLRRRCGVDRGGGRPARGHGARACVPACALYGGAGGGPVHGGAAGAYDPRRRKAAGVYP